MSKKDGGLLGALKSAGEFIGVEVGSDDQAQTPETEVTQDENAVVAERPAARPSLSIRPVAHSPAPLPGTVTPKVNVNPDVVEGKAAERFKKELEECLGASTPKYAQLNEAKAELTALLKDTVPAEMLEAVAMKGALKKVKFTEADVRAAVAAMRGKLQELRQTFEAGVQRTRAEKIEGPTKQIEEAQKEVARLEGEIDMLQQKILELKSGIQPTREAIAAAEQKIAQAKAIDDLADQKVLDYLSQFEQELLSQLPK